MKKTYMTPSVEIMSVAAEQLLTASGLDTDELQETEVDEGWSRVQILLLLSE